MEPVPGSGPFRPGAISERRGAAIERGRGRRLDPHRLKDDALGTANFADLARQPLSAQLSPCDCHCLPGVRAACAGIDHSGASISVAPQGAVAASCWQARTVGIFQDGPPLRETWPSQSQPECVGRRPAAVHEGVRTVRQRRAVARAGPTGLPRVAAARSLFLDMFAGACGVPHAARKPGAPCVAIDLRFG